MPPRSVSVRKCAPPAKPAFSSTACAMKVASMRLHSGQAGYWKSPRPTITKSQSKPLPAVSKRANFLPELNWGNLKQIRPQPLRDWP
ncbi:MULTISPECIES: EspF repeat-containing protein [Brucella]|uniref:EspF repeat-containing protein n=1 Tax=Brucella TaxID=234 RepID=UPI003364C3BE